MSREAAAPPGAPGTASSPGFTKISMSPPGWRPPTPAGPLLRSISRHSRERRAFNTGLFVSAVLHFLFIAVYPLLFGDPPARPPRTPAEVEQPVLEGTEIIELVELPDPPEPPPVQPTTEPVEDVQTQVVDLEAIATDDVSVGDGDLEDEELTVAERLRPRMIDPRFWIPLERIYTELTDPERAQLLLQGMIRNWNDSMAVAEALSEQAMDWTYTDDEGRRWGLSPGQLHLGDFSIPLPFSFALPSGRREAFADRQLIRDDLARGAATAIIRDTWAERARAIRERLEAERERIDPAGLGDIGGGGGGDR